MKVRRRDWWPKAFQAYRSRFGISQAGIHFVVITTAETNKADHSLPDADGVNRVKNGMYAISAQNVNGAVLGYYPDANNRSLSDKYAKWIENHYPNYFQRIVLVGGTGNNTVWDITSQADWFTKNVPAGSIIGFPSDWWHTRRVALTLYSMGYEVVWLTSQDTMNRKVWKENILFLMSWIDPRWEGFLGKILGILAQKEADKYKASTQSSVAQTS